MWRRDLEWQDDAACRNEDPELFFPAGRSGPAKLQAAEAKKVCAGCPVKDDCLEMSFEIGADHGVWGGLTEEERRALGRRQQAVRRMGRRAI